MGILAECPICHKKQATKNKVCRCGHNLDKAKRSQKVRYWIRYTIPGQKPIQQYVSTSIEEARDTFGKRRVQKRENRFFDMLPDSKFTFGELAEWYLNLASVQRLSSYQRIGIALANFNKIFGVVVAADIKSADIEDYQDKRLEQGIASTTLDVEVAIIKGMVSKAFDNEKLDGRVLRSFRRIGNKTRRGAGARSRTVTIGEYLGLLAEAPKHLRGILTVAMNTGMRPGEIRGLRWSYVDRQAGMIRLPAEVTKESRPKLVPINNHVQAVLDAQIRAIHHDYVFTYGNEPLSGPGTPKGAMRATCKRAKVPYGRKDPNGIILHDFRRTVKTNMVAAGVDKVYRDTILGHSLQGMDAHYIKPGEDSLQQAMTRYTSWLDDQIAESDQNGDQVANLKL